jgi:hypothetical protein
MSKPKYKDRVLGCNSEPEVSTRTFIAVTGNKLNLAGDTSSRFGLINLDTRLERPDLRLSESFAIKDFDSWIVASRQEIVWAVHTVVRMYLFSCRYFKRVPELVRKAQLPGVGSRFPHCETLRSATIMLEMPDPYGAFIESDRNSSTESDALAVVDIVQRALEMAAPISAYAAAVRDQTNHPHRARFRKAFTSHYNKLTPDEIQTRYEGQSLTQARHEHELKFVCRTCLRAKLKHLKTGSTKLTMAEILSSISPAMKADLMELARARTESAVAVGRWVKAHVVDSPVRGRVLRCAESRRTMNVFWIEWR